jgi:hypothetical protein
MHVGVAWEQTLCLLLSDGVWLQIARQSVLRPMQSECKARIPEEVQERVGLASQEGKKGWWLLEP